MSEISFLSCTTSCLDGCTLLTLLINVSNKQFKLNVEIIESASNSTALKLGIDVESKKPAEQNTQGRTPVSAIESGGSQDDEHLEAPGPSVPSRNTQPESVLPQTSTEEVLRLIAFFYLKVSPPRSMDDFNRFMTYMERMRVIITGVEEGSLLITVRCDSPQILEGLWKDYLSGCLGEVVQKCFVTEKLLADLSLTELKLKVTISEEEYEACKAYFERDPARG